LQGVVPVVVETVQQALVEDHQVRQVQILTQELAELGEHKSRVALQEF
jgi:DNA-binding protein